MKSSLKKKMHDITHITTVSDAFLVPRETLGRVSQALDLETTATSTGSRSHSEEILLAFADGDTGGNPLIMMGYIHI